MGEGSEGKKSQNHSNARNARARESDKREEDFPTSEKNKSISDVDKITSEVNQVEKDRRATHLHTPPLGQPDTKPGEMSFQIFRNTNLSFAALRRM